MNPTIDSLRCIGCGACVKVCPLKDVVIRMTGEGDDRKAVVLDADLCDRGRACERACPTKAFTFK